jgi:ribosomal protein S25
MSLRPIHYSILRHLPRDKWVTPLYVAERIQQPLTVTTIALSHLVSEDVILGNQNKYRARAI